MDFQQTLKNKIKKEVLSKYETWSVLVFDSIAGLLLQKLFKVSELVDCKIYQHKNIIDERRSFDFPVIYFIESGEDEKTINNEFNQRKYTKFYVFLLNEPKFLNKKINYSILKINVEPFDKNVFKCDYKKLQNLENILDISLYIKYLEPTQEISYYIHKKMKKENNRIGYLIVLDRKMDLFTPKLKFFTFYSALKSLNYKDLDDSFFDTVKYKHIGEVGPILQGLVNKLNQSIKDIKNKNLDELEGLVLEAPKNIELKNNISKYYDALENVFNHLEPLKEFIEAEQILVTGFDAEDRKSTRNLDYFFNFVTSTKYSKKLRQELVYLLKAREIKFTMTEKEILEREGLEDVSLDTSLHIKRNRPCDHQYDISRYKPMLHDFISNFITDKNCFNSFEEPPAVFGSLRKSTLLTSSKKRDREVLVVYMKGGITYEEMCVAARLSEEAGIDILLGSDEILSPV